MLFLKESLHIHCLSLLQSRKFVFDILGNRHRYLDFNCRTELTTANIKIFFPCQYLLIPSTDTKKVIK